MNLFLFYLCFDRVHRTGFQRGISVPTGLFCDGHVAQVGDHCRRCPFTEFLYIRATLLSSTLAGDKHPSSSAPKDCLYGLLRQLSTD